MYRRSLEGVCVYIYVSMYICLYRFHLGLLQTNRRIWRGCVSKISGGSVYLYLYMYICLYIFHLGLCKQIGELGDGVYRRSLEVVHIDTYLSIYLYISYRWRGTERHCGLVPVSALRQVVEKPCTVL